MKREQSAPHGSRMLHYGAAYLFPSLGLAHDNLSLKHHRRDVCLVDLGSMQLPCSYVKHEFQVGKYPQNGVIGLKRQHRHWSHTSKNKWIGA